MLGGKNPVHNCADSILVSELHYLSLYPENELPSVLQSSYLSQNAQNQINFFIDEVMAEKNDSFEKNYEWILAFESGILDGSYSNYDKEIILSLLQLHVIHFI